MALWLWLMMNLDLWALDVAYGLLLARSGIDGNATRMYAFLVIIFHTSHT